LSCRWNCLACLIRFISDIIYHLYLAAVVISAGVPNGEFPEILIAKCRSIFGFCVVFVNVDLEPEG
jgi:hypothetical protein